MDIYKCPNPEILDTLLAILNVCCIIEILGKITKKIIIKLLRYFLNIYKDKYLGVFSVVNLKCK